MATESKQSAALTSPGYLIPFITVTALFFIFGFITNLNMALVPHLRRIFTLPYAWAMLAESAFFLAYFVFSSPTSKLIEAIGYKKTMVVSLFIQVVGCLLFVPAAKMVSFPLFLTAVFIVGAGVTALQTSANPYVSILGPEGSSSIRLNLAQAFNSIGGTIAPLVAGAYILSDPAKLVSQAAIADTVRVPYILIAVALFLLGLALAFMRLPHIAQTQEFRPGKEGDPVLSRSIGSYRHTVLGALGIFFYVGVEVGIASIAVNYFLTQGIDSEKVASFFTSLGSFGALITSWFGPWTTIKIAAILVSLYWFGALVGRLLGSWMLTKIGAGRLLGIFGFAATAMVLVSMASSGQVAIWSLVLCGFFNSIMFPNIFTLGIAKLGPMTSKGSGIIMTAVFGGAVVPVLIGATADSFGLKYAFVIPVICYLFIAYYGLWGSKPVPAPAELKWYGWYVMVLEKFAEFRGRSRRKEYWLFQLVNLLIYVFLFACALLLSGSNGGSRNLLALAYVISLGLVIPTLACGVRRLHDTNRSGWLMLVNLIPLVGGIIVIYWLASDGDRGANQYGVDPKYRELTSQAG